MNTQGSDVAGERAQPQEGSAPLTNWTEDGPAEDAVPVGIPAVPCSNSVVETPKTFAATNKGESHTTDVASQMDKQTLADWAERVYLFKLLMMI
jgi:hypothetical protein